MSQPSTPLNYTAVASFLPSMNQEQHLSQADFEELFGSGGSDQPVLSLNNSDALEGLGFTYQAGFVVPVDSSNSFTTPTPNFSNHDFGQHVPAYPTPEPNSPHPYPLELQPDYPTTADQQEYNHHPRPIRPQTNNAYIYPVQPSQGYVRRRSLSTSDTDQIAAVNSINNPTFVRLQAPRARSTTPEDRRRNGIHARHGRCASQSPAPRCRPVNRTSTPYHVYSDSLVGGMLPTPIGTPLNEMAEAQGLDYGTAYSSAGTVDRTIYSDVPVFRHMTRPDQLARSRHIIEIGALVVSNRSALDPRFQPQSPITNRARILEKLGEIEEHLRDKEGEEALPACMTIRVILSRTMGAEDVVIADEIRGGHTDEPSEKHAESRCNMHDGHNDNEIMEMLMRENGVNGKAEEESGNKE